MRLIKFILLSGSLLLSGCSVFSPVQTAPKEVYLIDSLPSHIVQARRRNSTILVNVPDASSIYGSTDMAYKTNAYQLAYFSKSDWAASPGQMLQPLIVQTLQKTHHFHAVNQAPSLGSYDYMLSTQLYELVQDFRYDPSLLRMRVRAQIIRTSTGRVVATREFTEIVPTVVNAPYGGVIAANKASARILQQLAAFCVRTI